MWYICTSKRRIVVDLHQSPGRQYADLCACNIIIYQTILSLLLQPVCLSHAVVEISVSQLSFSFGKGFMSSEIQITKPTETGFGIRSVRLCRCSPVFLYHVSSCRAEQGRPMSRTLDFFDVFAYKCAETQKGYEFILTCSRHQF